MSRRYGSPAAAACACRSHSRDFATTGSGCARCSARARGSCSSTVRTIRPAPPPRTAIWMRSAALIRDHDTLVLSDEVYEHVVFDGAQHHSVLTHPELAARSFAVFSFGKTLHATGLRVGYCVAPSGAHTRVAQGAPVQYLQHLASPAARDRRLSHRAARWRRGLAAFFQAKRDRLRSALATPDSGCRPRRAPISSCSTSAPSPTPTTSPSPSVC